MIYDCLIIGGGPAGLTAGIYLARANKKVIVVEKNAFGGQMSEIGIIENYPGFEKVTGMELSMSMYEQAKKLGVEFIIGEAESFDLLHGEKSIQVNKTKLSAKSIIFAMGNKTKELGIPGEKEFFGKGVSYCATCDGNFFKNRDVAVVGTDDKALSNVKFLSGIAKKVYLVCKYKNLSLQTYSQEDINTLKNVEIILNSKVKKVLGTDSVQQIEIENEERKYRINLDGVFVSVGAFPKTEEIKDIVTLDKDGYIIVDENMKTNIDGVFACGDVTSNKIKQIVTATGSGATSAMSVIRFLYKS